MSPRAPRLWPKLVGPGHRLLEGLRAANAAHLPSGPWSVACCAPSKGRRGWLPMAEGGRPRRESGGARALGSPRRCRPRPPGGRTPRGSTRGRNPPRSRRCFGGRLPRGPRGLLFRRRRSAAEGSPGSDRYRSEWARGAAAVRGPAPAPAPGLPSQALSSWRGCPRPPSGCPALRSGAPLPGSHARSEAAPSSWKATSRFGQGPAGGPSEGHSDQRKGAGCSREDGRPVASARRLSAAGDRRGPPPALQAFFSGKPSPPAKMPWLQPSDWWPLAVIDRPLPGGGGGSRVNSRRNRPYLGFLRLCAPPPPHPQ